MNPPRPSRKTKILTVAAAAAVLLAVTGCLGSGQASNTGETPEAGSIEAVAEKLAMEQASERAELNARLAESAEVAHGHLSQVLQELASAVPVAAGNSSHPAGIGEVEGWHHNLALAVSALEAVHEGTSEQTVTREALLGAAGLLQSAADAYEHVLQAPAGERDVLAATVADRREKAVRLWQAGAAQLDTLTVGSGGGHVHVFLAPDGDPDAVPEEFQEPESRTAG